MKLLKSILLGLVLVGSATVNVAWASHSGSHFAAHRSFQHHGGWGHGHGYYWGAGFYVGGWPWFYPWYYGYAVPVLPYSFYSETATPVEYVEMNPPNPPHSANEAPANVWYYCRNPQGYYPYIKSCAGGWQKVAPQPSN